MKSVIILLCLIVSLTAIQECNTDIEDGQDCSNQDHQNILDRNQEPTVFAYWPFRGLGQHLKFLLEYLEVKFEDKRYQQEEWVQDKQVFLETSPIANLPYLKHEGKMIYESTAIALYIIHKMNRADLLGLTLDEKVKIEQARGVIGDLRKYGLKIFWAPKEEYELRGREIFRENTERFLIKLEAMLIGGNFIAGNISMADFSLYDFIDLIRHFDPNYLSQFPNLTQHHSNFSEIPQIKNYITSERFQARPFYNTKSSNWG